MIRNLAGQVIGAQLVSASDGSAFTGAVTVAVTVDGGTQATGGTGSGACTHEGNGYHTYVPTAAETHGGIVAFTFTGTGAIPVTVQVFPTSAILRRATAQAGAAASITLDASASATNDFYNGCAVQIVAGTGAGQAPRTVSDYDGSTKVATVDTSWAVQPDSTSVFEILAVPPAPASVVASLGTDAIGSDQLAASAITEIQNGLATAALIAALNNLSAAEVNAEVVDALATDARGEPGQGAPPVSASMALKIDYLYKYLRNRRTQTADTLSLYADDGTTVDHKAPVSDDGTTFDRGELVTGP